VIAESGDTLWAIAQRIAPNTKITEVVDQLVLMNGDQITTGQLVRIP
jgi:nucleoid-associated protein YgaU